MLGVLATIGAVAAGSTFAGFHSMLPTSQLYGASFIGLPAGSRRLALTFDDGPNDIYTERLLEVLARHQVKATFFLLGKFVAERPHLARRVAEAGHAVGCHAYTHRNLIFLSAAELRAELEMARRVIEDATGIRPSLFRPPFGGRRPGTFAVARRQGFTPVMWRISCKDWALRSAAEIVQRGMRQIRGGEVILLHDGGHLRLGTDRGPSVEAAGELITRCHATGYQFVTIPEMLAVT